MEIMLAIVVMTAVIFFGALISMGNERQRRAIDELREQTTLWAVQDLLLKRESIARDVRVDNPQAWLNTIASRICGSDLELQVIESFDEPQALFCASGDGQKKIVFTPHSPADIRNIKKNKHSRLGRLTGQNPLLSLPKNVGSHQLSALNCGMLFDLELKLAWLQVTGRNLEAANLLWMHEYS